jgi:hypothetical protein
VLGRDLTGGDIVNLSQGIRGIVLVATPVTDSDFYVLENNEAALVLEGFTLDALSSYGSFTVLTLIIEIARHFYNSVIR